MEENQTLPQTEQYQFFATQLKFLVEKIYGEEIVDKLIEQIFNLVKSHLSTSPYENSNKWSENNILLITYGDTICGTEDESPLQTLDHFLSKYLQDTVTGVHILPFFPYSSDDGFAVIDYLAVNPKLGQWENIKSIATKFNLMVDLVINHISSQSEWFKQFVKGEKPGCDYFIEIDPNQDISQVVRPRSSPLVAKVETVNGEKYVWATFSHDQIDLNFKNPDVLLEFIKIILFYVQIGAKYIRLDAVGYLWKHIGTPCIHLRETHLMIKLLRQIFQTLDSSIALITETNVPNRENLSYFGNRDEAHMIYNFSLPPLLLNALITGKSRHLQTWMMSMPPAPRGCAFFNFTASHDGIGLRPVEGILTEEETTTLVKTMKKFGAKFGMRSRPDGTQSVYEINISLFDALKGTTKGKDKWQIQRFICSQTIMMSLEGIPAFYLHSLLATNNDKQSVETTGINRSINRYKWDCHELEELLTNPNSPQLIVFNELSRLIRIRRCQKAFHPNATQYTLHLGKHLFAFWRQSLERDQSIFSVHNLTNKTHKLSLSLLNLINTEQWFDLISGQAIENIYGKFKLKPYQSVWITNKN